MVERVEREEENMKGAGAVLSATTTDRAFRLPLPPAVHGHANAGTKRGKKYRCAVPRENLCAKATSGGMTSHPLSSLRRSRSSRITSEQCSACPHPCRWTSPQHARCSAAATRLPLISPLTPSLTTSPARATNTPRFFLPRTSLLFLFPFQSPLYPLAAVALAVWWLA